MRTRKALVALLAGMLAMVAGCGPGGFNGMYNVPLPGGADVGEHPYTITARFDNVLNLVPQAAVKVNSVAVGNVTRIELSQDARSAIVTMTINSGVDLPANATAQLRQASLLGAKYVALSAPDKKKPVGTLTDGARIPSARTGRTAEIEEVFGALSLLLSGGGVEQIRTIAKELNNALSGNEAEIRALLSRADKLATELDAQKADIVRAIDGLHKLSKTLVEQTENLTDALENLGPGLKILNRQQDKLVQMLTSLKKLADVSVEVINASGSQVVANLKALRPVLDRLADAGQYLPEAMRILPTYPYPAYAGKTIKGDYANVDVIVDLRLDTLAENFKGRVDQILDILPDSLPGGPEGSQDLLPLSTTSSPDASGAQGSGDQASGGQASGKQDSGEQGSGAEQTADKGTGPAGARPLGGVLNSLLGGDS